MNRLIACLKVIILLEKQIFFYLFDGMINLIKAIIVTTGFMFCCLEVEKGRRRRLTCWLRTMMSQVFSDYLYLAVGERNCS